MAARVLCVAFDSADPALLRQWAADGHLPAIHHLLQQGTAIVTQGPTGMVASVWQTFYTAALPATQGRHADHQIRTGTYEIHRFLPKHLRREPFWHALSRSGRRVAVIDAPYVTVSHEFNGIHVVDWATHAADEGFGTWPPDLGAQIVARFGRDPVGLCDDLRLRSAQEVRAFRDAIIARIDQKLALATHLLQREAWDFFLVAFGESHCIGHQCWHLHDPRDPTHDPAVARVLGDPMRDVYAALDRALQRILSHVGPDTIVCFLTTHGMGPCYHGAHLLGPVLQRLGHLPAVAEPTPVRRLLRAAWRRLPARVRAPLIPLQKAYIDRTRPHLDPRATCFDVPNGEVFGAIRVNLVGREPAGKIRPGSELEAFCATLRDDLCALVNEETGAPAVRQVLRTRDLFAGPYLDDLPDLLVEWNKDAPLRRLHSPKTGTVTGEPISLRTGHHHLEGLCVICGPGIAPRQLREVVAIENLAPTIAQFLGVTLADVDGRPIPFPLAAP